MLYRSDLKVLCFLKKIQQDESYYVSVNTDFCSGVQCKKLQSTAEAEAWDNERPRRLKMPQSSFSACLVSLEKQGLITQPVHGSLYQVTHDGWNAFEVIRKERMEFIMTHALFPCFVSIATTAILWIIRFLLL